MGKLEAKDKISLMSDKGNIKISEMIIFDELDSRNYSKLVKNPGILRGRNLLINTQTFNNSGIVDLTGFANLDLGSFASNNFIIGANSNIKIRGDYRNTGKF